ncbi:MULTISPECIES: MerR family DNA-binding transcriptional regulator [unclassified Pseudomonas]|uniref:MerR family DNA-binding transcriptional regulator n=1 Tax=unclassified Pseudomonas TaxID=196821 RepID=UPI0010F6CCF1|nr:MULTISPECIES: MerR family DNA-binding transcriptional regulator [unclassified Pseudomonas]
MNTQTAPLTIGAVAKRVGVAINTIRYYERLGLLPKPPRRASNYRSCGDGAIAQLRFNRRAINPSLTLKEILDLLTLPHNHQKGVAAVKQRAQLWLVALNARIAELQRVCDGLAQRVESCPGHGAPDHCPSLRVLTHEEMSS